MGIEFLAPFASKLILSLYDDLKRKRNSDCFYIAYSVSLRYQEKEKFLLGDEKNLNYYKPIGGVLKHRAIREEMGQLYELEASKKKPRGDLDLAFEVFKPRKKYLFLYDKAKKFTQILNKKLFGHNFESYLKNELIREVEEEFGVILKPDDFEGGIKMSMEKKKYENGIWRYHIYFTIPLKKDSSKKLLKHESIRMLELKSRNKKHVISDLSDILKNSKDLSKP